MILVNNAWRTMFPFAEVKVLEVATSDHLPLPQKLKG